MVLAETFLTAADEEHFSFPREFVSFSSPALREKVKRGKGGRSAGGITVLVRASLFVLPQCHFEIVNAGLVTLKLVTKTGLSFTLVTGYRTSNEGSSFFVPDFFVDLQDKCLQLSENQEKFLLLGDFNAKIGDSSSVIGQSDEFSLLVPAVSSKPLIDPLGKQFLESLAGCDLVILPFANPEGVYPITCKANHQRESIEGGSVIDLGYASLALIREVTGLRVEFERELSSHAWLQVGLQQGNLTPQVCDNPAPPPPPRTVMSFDLEKLHSFSHTPALIELADGGDFTVTEALEAIMEFVGGFTVTKTVSGVRDAAKLDSRLQEIRRRARKLERSMKKARDPCRKLELEQAMREEMEAWRSEREAVALEKQTQLREQFFQARKVGHQHLAWRLARTHLSGKGGGIRTSATTCLDRHAWEEHFSSIFQNERAEDLASIDLGDVVDDILDAPITAEEVRRALEKKRNLRAPGPDGFRVDFLRYVRHDEVVCSALARFFNLIVQSGEVPAAWSLAFLFVLFKGKGDRADPNSYRGITLKSQFLKLLESVICGRLVEWIENNGLLPPEQLAYRCGLSGTDHLFVLNILKEDAILTGKALCVGLIDLQKAFPSVNRKRLVEDLVGAGVSTRTVALVRRLYMRDSFRLLLDGEPGHLVFCVVCGVHEGSCLSPTLFIFFIRDLPRRLNLLTLNCPVVGGMTLSCMFFADDLTVMAYAVPDAQALVDESVSFFSEKGLKPNPSKCEFLVFGQTRGTGSRWSVCGVSREQQSTARYLGLHFQADGRWDIQLQLSTSKARSALGRCKIIMKTIGTGNVRLALSFFDSIVASVYRFGFGVWGVSVAKVATLDRLFAEYICWLFRFPKTTGTNIILSNFGRRCAKCDSLFLAAVQLAGARTTRNVLWKGTVQDLQLGVLNSTWYNIVESEISKRGMTREVAERGADLIANRKLYGVYFSQYCYLHHTNVPTGRSSDQFRRGRPFGIFPFLLSISSHQTRFLFSFLCSVWRYIDGKACERYPEYCTRCDRLNTGYHVLFECVVFSDLRSKFTRASQRDLSFSFDVLRCESVDVCRLLVATGREIFERVRMMCPS